MMAKTTRIADRADVDQNLREPDELRAELKIQRGQSGKAERQGQDAMHQIAQAIAARHSERSSARRG